LKPRDTDAPPSRVLDQILDRAGLCPRPRFEGRQKAIYELVLAAEIAAIGAVAPGARGAQPHPPAVRTLAACLAGVGLDPAPQGFGAATDLAWYGERNLPGIICGPGRLAQCHVADEYLDTEQLDLAAKVYALMITYWCG
jgi:acetylornithine deacetylase/succinyl-diaminopimelate desuccinylase-like protein